MKWWPTGMFGKDRIRFRCNICGNVTGCAKSTLSREQASCERCGSTVRMRAIIHYASCAIYGKSLALPDFPRRPDVRGIGLSDWQEYAQRLAGRVNYTNTYYHTEPYLDITNIPDEMAGTCDFVLSTDVFEHVCPPVSRAFEGARRLLKPGGTLVLTVPFMLEEKHSREHFPNLDKFEIVGEGEGPFKLINTRPSGEVEVFEDLIFHGGPGSTLEMRLFAKDALRHELEQAGFSEIQFVQEPVPKFGILWHLPWSTPVIARAPT